MSHRIEEKEARRHERERAQEKARQLEARHRRQRTAGYAAIGLIAAALVTFSVIGSSDNPSSAPAGHEGMGGGGAAGPAVGQRAPEFALTDVVSGQTISSTTMRKGKTLLFFSEGVNCQACMVQAADLGKASGVLRKQGIRLISVTTDNPGDLGVAARQYGITTPLLADPTTGMSQAYGMLGHGGMGHPAQDGHAFMLVQDGKVVWHRAYQEMYVKTPQLMQDMAKEMQA